MSEAEKAALALMARAGRGDVVAQRTLSQLCVCIAKQVAREGRNPFELVFEAAVFARLAATRGGAEDQAVLQQLIDILPDDPGLAFSIDALDVDPTPEIAEMAREVRAVLQPQRAVS